MAFFNDIKGLFGSKNPKDQILISPTSNFFKQLSPTDDLNYLEQFHDWTYIASNRKADAISDYPMKLYKTGDRDMELTGKLLKELLNFNPHQTYWEARRVTRNHLDLTGMAFWVIMQGDNGGREFYILDPLRMKANLGSYGLPKSWSYRQSTGQERELSIDNVIVFRQPDPRNWLKGMGALQASLYAHNSHEYAMKYNMSVFNNSGRPDGLIIIEGLGKDQVKVAEEKLRQRYGGTNNARKLGILNKMATFLEISKTQKDLDFVKGIELMRDQILSTHGVPKTLVGIDDSTYANASEAIKVFQKLTLKPMLQLERDVFNSQLIPKYLGRQYVDQLEFDFDNPVEQDKDLDSTVAVKLYQGGVIKRNEARELVALDEDPKQGDEYYIVPRYQEPVPTKDNKEIEKLQARIKYLSRKFHDLPITKEAEAEARNELRKFIYEKQVEGETSFIKLQKKYFKAQEKRVLKQLKGKKSVDVTLEFNLAKETQYAVDMFRDFYIEEAKKYNNMANELTGGSVAMRKEMIAKIEAELYAGWSTINETTRNQLVDLIATAVEEDIASSEVAGQINTIFTEYTKTRVNAIARTELNRVKNNTQRDNYANNEDVVYMEWLTAHDSFVRGLDPHDRFDHVSADGQRVSKGAKFRVSGEWLAYPSDGRGSAGNTINCRCTVIPVVEY